MRCYRLVQVYVIAAMVTSGLMPGLASAQTDAKFPVRAEALLADYVQSELFSGTVLVARNGIPIFRKGYGPAEREWMIPNAANTKFRIGSVTKQFTAAGILRLVDEHKLGLDDPIKKHLSAIPASWERITIRQLLAHTSGIPSYTGNADFDDKLIRVEHTPQQLVDLVKDQALYFEPGTKHRYSNTGYILLGRIIEVASGLSYQDYLEQQLLKPLKLISSGYDDGHRVLANAAQDYTDGVDSVVKGGLVDMSNVYAAGAMYATVDDLLAWQQMLVSGKVISPASTLAMLTDGGFHNGLGWFIRERFSRKVYEHGGSLKGFSSIIAYYPDDKLTVIILSNYGEEVVSKIGTELAGLALGMPPAHRQIKVESQLYSRVAGRYQLGDAILTIAPQGDRLFAKLSGQKQLEIYPESEYSYFYKAVEAVVTFGAGMGGKVDHLTLLQDGQKIRAQRIN